MLKDCLSCSGLTASGRKKIFIMAGCWPPPSQTIQRSDFYWFSEVLITAASATEFPRANALNPPEMRSSCTTASQNASASIWASPHTSSVQAVGTLFNTPSSCATTSPAIGM